MAASRPSTRGRRRHQCCPRGHGPKVPPATLLLGSASPRLSPTAIPGGSGIERLPANTRREKSGYKKGQGWGCLPAALGLFSQRLLLLLQAPRGYSPAPRPHCRGQPPPGSGGEGTCSPPVRGDGGTAEGLEEAGAGTLGLRSKGRETIPKTSPVRRAGCPHHPQTPGFAPLGKNSLTGGRGGLLAAKKPELGAELPAKETRHFVIGAASPPSHHSPRTMRH